MFLVQTLRIIAAAVYLLLLSPAAADAQAGQVGPIQLPTVTVTAQKEPADAQTLPVSLTALSRDWLAGSGIETVREAGMFAPNTFFSDFTARKLSNPRFRGIGSSPANPSITTYLDGVPQLNSNTSSIALIDIEQIEFVRGPQSALFGRNTLGGLINIASARPSLTDWTAMFSAPVSSHASRDMQGSFSGPLAAGRVGVGGSILYSRRNGYTVNDLTGNDLDSRSAVSGKAQLLWTPSSVWEARVIVTGERARDGDYALSDLGGLRRNPFRTARNFEGHTDRDILGTTLLTRRVGERVHLSTTTGFVRWNTLDATDLDYTPLPLVTRENAEKSVQFTQEVRLASAAPGQASAQVPLKWQAGVFFFTQNYEQDAVNNLSPFVLSPFIGFPVSQHAPQSTLDDVGVGFYGQVTATLAERLDLSAGARVDHEKKEASLNTFFSPAIAPARLVTPKEDFSNVSPQASVAYRVQPETMVYTSVGRGFKAGGFNAASPSGSEAYGEEHTWNVEGGVKSSWAGGRVTANAGVFRIDWEELQLNLPDPAVPAQFYIANVGGASSRGVEFELNARVHQALHLFSAIGTTNARFKDGSRSSGVDVSDNKIPNTPDYTATAGARASHLIRSDTTLYGRAEMTMYGAFKYDDLNMAEQERYSLANVRVGVRGPRVFAEAWVKNAFDTHYIPVAFAFGALAPSGFLGEMGAPRTFGFGAGITF